MYWNQTRAQWETVESHMDQNGYLVCNTNHFSTWTVAEQADSAESIEAANQGIPVEYVYIGVATIAIIAAVVGILFYKQRK